MVELAIHTQRSQPTAATLADPAEPSEKLAAPSAEINDACCLSGPDSWQECP